MGHSGDNSPPAPQSHEMGRVRAGLLFCCGLMILIALHALAMVVLDWTTVLYGIVFGGTLLGIWLWTDGTRRLIAITVAAVVSVAAREMLLPLLHGPQQVVGLALGILLGVLNVREIEFWRRLRASQRVVEWPRWRVFRPNVYVRSLLMIPPLLAIGFLGWHFAIHVRHERLVAEIKEYGGSAREAQPPELWQQLGLDWSYGGFGDVRIVPDDFSVYQSRSTTYNAVTGAADERLNGIIREIGAHSPGMWRLAISRADISDEALTTFDDVHELTEVIINCPRVSDSGARFLTDQPSLTSLNLTGTAVTGDFLASNSNLPRLRQLFLNSTQLNDLASVALPAMRGLRQLELRGTQITDTAMIHVGKCLVLNRLDISDTKVTDAGLRYLMGLSLSALKLDNCDVTIDGLAPLCKATSLSELSAAGTDLSSGDLSRLTGPYWLILNDAVLPDGALGQLAKINTLVHVELNGTAVDDEDVESLRQYPNFGSLVAPVAPGMPAKLGVAVPGQPGMRRIPYGALSLSGTQITDQSLAVIGSLKFLRSIDVSQTGVTDDGVRHLVEMPHLNTLNLSGTKITDASLDVLSQCKELVYLYIPGTSVTDTGLQKLHGCENLRLIDVSDTRVSPAAIEQFREANPSIGWIHAP